MDEEMEEEVTFWPEAGEGIVISVVGTDGLIPNFGDRIETGIFAPIDDDSGVGVVAGEEYDILMITPDETTQVLMIYNLNVPELRDQMSYVVTEVGALGGEPDFKRGDTFTIQIQLGNSLDSSAPEDSLDVTFSFSGSVFSFIVPSDAPAPTAETLSVSGEAVSPTANGAPRPVVVPLDQFPIVQLDELVGTAFQMQTRFLENQNKCFNGNNIMEADILEGGAFMDDCNAGDPGQLWTLVPWDDSDAYKLITLEGANPDYCLESNEFGFEVANGASLLNECIGVTGQLWHIYETELPGYYRLSSVFQEADNKCLEGNRLAPESVKEGAAFMDNCLNVTGQYWKFVDGTTSGDDDSGETAVFDLSEYIYLDDVILNSFNYPDRYLVTGEGGTAVELLPVANDSPAELQTRAGFAIYGTSGSGEVVLLQVSNPAGAFVVATADGVALSFLDGSDGYTVEDALFFVVPGLAGQGLSFESTTIPNHYLRHFNFVLQLNEYNDTQLYLEDATFIREAQGNFAEATPESAVGILQGQVLDATTAEPIPNALVCIHFTDACVFSDDSGNYTMPDLPAEELLMGSRAEGYFIAEETVTIVAGETVMQNFVLSPEIVEGDIRIVLTWGESPSDLVRICTFQATRVNLSTTKM
ncbi:MAG: AbfB domain-containing protein, partial [Chloroflexota bacterium]